MRHSRPFQLILGRPDPVFPRRVAARRFGRTVGDRRRCPSKYQWRRRGGAARRRAKARSRVRSRASRVRRRGRAARPCGFVDGVHGPASLPLPTTVPCHAVRSQWSVTMRFASASDSASPNGAISSPRVRHAVQTYRARPRYPPARVALGPRAERRCILAAKEAKDAKKAIPGRSPPDLPSLPRTSRPRPAPSPRPRPAASEGPPHGAARHFFRFFRARPALLPPRGGPGFMPDGMPGDTALLRKAL